jgi:3-methyladenine DNA glycosylase Tag
LAAALPCGRLATSALGTKSMPTPPFGPILAAAESRHGAEGIAARLVVPKTPAELAALPDDRYLSLMSLRIFRAGLKHELVDAKWPAFEEVWHGFDLARCARVWDEELEEILADRRLIRHLGKLRSIRTNAAAMLAVAAEHGSFGNWLAGWPGDDVVGLWEALAKRFAQLGGNSAPMFLRMAGKDTFVPTDSVTRGLVRWHAMPTPPTSRAERRAMQGIFNEWANETGRPLCELSLILALSCD